MSSLSLTRSLTRNANEHFIGLEDSLGTTDQTFKIEFYNYNPSNGRNLKWTQVGLITFNKNDIKEYTFPSGKTIYIVDRKIKSKNFWGTGPVTQTVEGYEVPNDLLVLAIERDKDGEKGYFNLYERTLDDKTKKPDGGLALFDPSVRLLRTTSELFTSPFKTGGLKYRTKSRRIKNRTKNRKHRTRRLRKK